MADTYNPAEYGKAPTPEDNRNLEAAGAVWNSSYKKYDLPNGASISSFYYPGRGYTYSVYKPGTSRYSAEYKAPKFGSITAALKSL